MLSAGILMPLTETVTLHTGHRATLPVLPLVNEVVPNVPLSLLWFRNINVFMAGRRAMAIVPLLAAPSEDGGGAIGEISIAGNSVSNSGSATTEFRAVAGPADASGSVVASGLAGTVWNHNLASQNHITMVYADGSGHLGDVWVVRGTNSDTIYNTGNYTGALTVVAMKSVNAKSISQTQLVVGAGGALIQAAINTMPLAIAEADTAGYQGELYAVREPTGWRIRRSGSANVGCRIAVFKLN